MKGVIMANSLRSKIKKLRHDNNISEKMCNELLEKLEGHDRELRAKTLKEMGNVLPIATIKFSKEDMQKIVDEKVAQIELDVQEIRNKAIDEFVEAIRDICHKYPIGNDADTNEPLYAHEDGTWHNLIDDVTEQMKAGE